MPTQTKYVKNSLGQFVPAPQSNPVYHLTKTVAPVHAGNKLVGFTKVINGKLVFEKWVRSNHHMTVPPGWGIDAETWESYLKKTVEEIHLLNRETGKRYILRSNLVVRDAFKFNRGFGWQYGIAERYWEIVQER